MEATVLHDLLREMLDRFLLTHSPPGQEEEMAEAARPYLEDYCDDVWSDAHDDLIGKTRSAAWSSASRRMGACASRTWGGCRPGATARAPSTCWATRW